MYKNKKKGIAGIIITIVIIILLVVFTNSSANQVSYIQNICNIFVMLSVVSISLSTGCSSIIFPSESAVSVFVRRK